MATKPVFGLVFAAALLSAASRHNPIKQALADAGQIPVERLEQAEAAHVHKYESNMGDNQGSPPFGAAKVLKVIVNLIDESKNDREGNYRAIWDSNKAGEVCYADYEMRGQMLAIHLRGGKEIFAYEHVTPKMMKDLIAADPGQTKPFDELLAY